MYGTGISRPEFDLQKFHGGTVGIPVSMWILTTLTGELLISRALRTGWVRIKTPRRENNTNFLLSNAQEKAATRGGQRGALHCSSQWVFLAPTNPTHPLHEHLL
jgi:hypothetical protein